MEPRLPTGYVLRACRPDDLPGAMALLSDRFGAADAQDLQLIVEDSAGGLANVAVVEHEASRSIVSTLTLMDESIRVGSTLVPAGQIELVTTAAGHERRGLVRALMTWAHTVSAARGHLVLPMVGITNFYRKFGYDYSIPMPLWLSVQSAPPASDERVVIRDATVHDVPALGALHDAEQAGFDIAMAHSPACWRWCLARSGSRTIVAERDGVVVATARLTPPDEDPALGEFAAADGAAAVALLRHVVAAAPDVVLQHRPSTIAGAAVDEFLRPSPEPERDADWHYIRISDLTALLNHLRGELSARLAAAAVEPPDQLLISSFESHVTAPIADGRIGEFAAGGVLQGPVSAGGSGVPRDWWAPLVFGPDGAAELERRVPDVMLGRQRELMTALFPPQRADLLTFYLPV